MVTGLAGWSQEAEPDGQGRVTAVPEGEPAPPGPPFREFLPRFRTLQDQGLPAPCTRLRPSRPPALGPAPASRPGYHAIEGLPTPLQDLPDARAVLPACLALPDQGGVGGKEDAL